ncbi:MAG: phosphopyruvate hydratase [Alphaproteobacteria bacterium]|nr:phosphopyruvate hydratase [Alphaproteobacteria bacterium]
MSSIRSLSAYSVLSSNGMPTVEVKITLQSGITAHAAAPKGQSCGKFEKTEHRDQDGLRVSEALRMCEFTVAPAFIGRDSADHLDLDKTLMSLAHDGKPLPSNVTLPVSIALAIAHSKEIGQDLSHYIGGISQHATIPIPCINMINGGIHGNNQSLLQEYLILPHGASSFSEAISWAVTICHNLKLNLKKKGLLAGVGDEGGFVLATDSVTAPFDILLESIHTSGLSDAHVSLGIDCAASGYYHKHMYVDYPGLPGEKQSAEVSTFLKNLAQTYPITYIEDPFSEEDLNAWASFDVEAHIIGDDLFATNAKRLNNVSHQAANGIMIKPNQVGTLSDTMQTIMQARLLGYNTVFAHRSADTEDTWISELAIGFQADMIKFGNIIRGERTAKYNALLRFFRIKNL